MRTNILFLVCPALHTAMRFTQLHSRSALCIGASRSFPFISRSFVPNLGRRSLATSTKMESHAEMSKRGTKWTPAVADVPLMHYVDQYQWFDKLLAKSIEAWKKSSVKAIWLRLATEACELFPVAIGHGFLPHHAAPDHITLTLWLDADKNRLPPGPSHFVGVNGFLYDDSTPGQPKVLVVQEKTGPTAGIGLWKLPGGLVDPKEDISVAAVREVREETGIDSEFVALSSVMEAHAVLGPGREGTTDLFCVCCLRLPAGRRGGELPRPVIQEAEIAEARWIPVNELLEQPVFSKGMFAEIFRAAVEVSAGRAAGFSAVSLLVTHRNLNATLLLPSTIRPAP